MIAYRLHFDEASVEAIETVQSGIIGDPRFFNSVFTQQLAEDNSRAKARFWANPLPDMGPYPINSAKKHSLKRTNSALKRSISLNVSLRIDTPNRMGKKD